ncbi:Nucleotide-binding universal stress protein, UspA family [Duganella sacchari]|uniref:Nucleotide-binding universal stress protein, UspA family n=1 Tax=Duganella sacchari TaxID=551987 RepID=A0A1M7LFC3_9BURK|nr:MULTISPECIES: universal stress protein [Duganella]MYM28060.1 universal stress protein [Duganella sp. CY15W]SHM76739.1 Nucleotide-binding universal stress protein, UspA family [Duganella sacchari]
MTYKNILLHADLSPHAASRYELACQVALSHEAHLVGAAFTGLTMECYRNAAFGYGGMLAPTDIDAVTGNSAQALDRFVVQAKAAGVSFERRISDDDSETGLVLQSRYADLLVLSQSDPELTGPDWLRKLPEHLTLHSGRPVLLVPYAGRYTHIDRHALVAWDGSRAATRAVTDALPLLRRSQHVTLAVFNAQTQYGVHGEQPGADIALYLARHGVRVEVTQQHTPAGLDIGNALLSLSADLGADLLVMGAYGHQRWREIVLGGVTRRVLQSMTLPVLMAH